MRNTHQTTPVQTLTYYTLLRIFILAGGYGKQAHKFDKNKKKMPG
jgi:hypothetical protein